MPDQAISLPGFAQRLASLGEDDRKAAVTSLHPEYAAHLDVWVAHLAAFEGDGGFLTGEYLWPYPAESETDYLRRQKMARYHNYVETLVDLYVRFMFTQGVKRTSTNSEFNAWLENVDGAGTAISDLLKRLPALALVPGHAAVLVDKTPEAPVGPSKADERAQVFATVFTATAIADWRFDRNTLAAVKLIEASPATDITEAQATEDAKRWLIWDREGWARYSSKGDLLDGDVPDLGLVPLAILRPKPSLLSLMLGRALVSNVNVIRALYNRASEEDNVLRDQAFSLLTCEVPENGDVQQARDQIGNVFGSAKAIAVQGKLEYITPDQSVPGAIRENIAYLVQEVYRAAHMRFSRDSLASETAEAIRLQHTELNEMLQGFAKGLAQVEREIARAWFAWSFPTKEQAQSAFEAAKVEAIYPTEFFLDDLATELDEWAAAIRLGLGETMTRRIKKRAARRLDPEMPADEQKKVDAEIDAMPAEMPSAFPLDTGRNTDVVPPGEATA